MGLEQAKFNQSGHESPKKSLPQELKDFKTRGDLGLEEFPIKEDFLNINENSLETVISNYKDKPEGDFLNPLLSEKEPDVELKKVQDFFKKYLPTIQKYYRSLDSEMSCIEITYVVHLLMREKGIKSTVLKNVVGQTEHWLLLLKIAGKEWRFDFSTDQFIKGKSVGLAVTPRVDTIVSFPNDYLPAFYRTEELEAPDDYKWQASKYQPNYDKFKIMMD